MHDLGLGAGLAALAFWGFVAAVVVGGMWYDIRKKEAQHETLRRVVESGQTIDKVFMDKLVLAIGGGSKQLDRDLMIGSVVTLSAAPGFALLGWFISLGSEGALLPLLGVGALAGCAGIGLYVASKVVTRYNSGQGQTTAGHSES